MKIALVLSRPPGYSETFFLNKIQLLLKKGYEVELFVDKEDKDFKLCAQKSLPSQTVPGLAKAFVLTFLLNPIRVIRFLSAEINSGNNFVSASRKIYANLHLLNSTGLNWVHFGFATMAIGRENIAKIVGAKMAVSFRGYDISRYPLRHVNAYAELWKRVDKVHTISNALAAKAIKLGMPANIPVVKITPAIDTNKFRPVNPIKKLSHPLKITTVARLHWSKGLEYTIEALGILHQNQIPFTYTIIGDGQELERLILAAQQLGIRDKIHFAGKTDHATVSNYLSATDIYIQYSVQEGFCNAVLEAQAMGLICIVSDAEGLPENVLNEISGWVVPRRSPKLLAEKIIEITKYESQTLDTIRQNAIARVSSSFTLENQSGEFVKFYSE